MNEEIKRINELAQKSEKILADVIEKLKALQKFHEDIANGNYDFNHKDPQDIDRATYPDGIINEKEQDTDTGYPYKH